MSDKKKFTKGHRPDTHKDPRDRQLNLCREFFDFLYETYGFDPIEATTAEQNQAHWEWIKKKRVEIFGEEWPEE